MTGQVYDHEHIQLAAVWDAISLFCGRICIAVEQAYVCEFCSASAGRTTWGLEAVFTIQLHSALIIKKALDEYFLVGTMDI